jgi:hypothetical protein
MDGPAFSGDALITFVAFIIAATAIFTILRMVRSRHARRLRHLEEAKELLQSHFDAAEQLLKDPAVSSELKKFICFASEVFGRKDFALNFAAFVWDAPNKNQMERTKVISDEIQKLAKYRPDLAQLAFTAIFSGLIAMMLRWPETEDASIALLSRSPNREPMKQFKEQSLRIFQAAPPELCPI